MDIFSMRKVFDFYCCLRCFRSIITWLTGTLCQYNAQNILLSVTLKRINLHIFSSRIHNAFIIHKNLLFYDKKCGSVLKYINIVQLGRLKILEYNSRVFITFIIDTYF